jgi:hypothetical protein
MSDDKYRAYQPTGSETLEKLVMDPNIPKSETEGWACREIARLRAENKKLRAEVRSLLEHRHLADFYARDATNARVEADKLRARVEVLEAALHAIFPDGANIKLVPKANAEEAKP